MRVYNFSAGPSTLPLDVLEQAQREFLDFSGTGMSVTEISHRSKPFEAIAAEGEALLRELLNISEDYAVLFVQGGASTQFAAVPLNLMHKGRADYVVTGNFAKKAFKEAEEYSQRMNSNNDGADLAELYTNRRYVRVQDGRMIADRNMLNCDLMKHELQSVIYGNWRNLIDEIRASGIKIVKTEESNPEKPVKESASRKASFKDAFKRYCDYVNRTQTKEGRGQQELGFFGKAVQQRDGRSRRRCGRRLYRQRDRGGQHPSLRKLRAVNVIRYIRQVG